MHGAKHTQRHTYTHIFFGFIFLMTCRMFMGLIFRPIMLPIRCFMVSFGDERPFNLRPEILSVSGYGYICPVVLCVLWNLLHPTDALTQGLAVKRLLGAAQIVRLARPEEKQKVNKDMVLV